MRSSGISGMVFGAFLMAVGAILAWAVTYEAEGIDLEMVGLILFVTGLAVALVSFVVGLIPRRSTVRTETDVVHTRPAPRREVIVDDR